MDLKNLAIPTAVMRAGMSIGDFLRECVKSDVPGLPFANEQGEIVGRISIRHCFKECCIPHFMIDTAHLLGDEIEAVNIPHIDARRLLDEPVERYLLSDFPHATPNSPLIKGLAFMEQLNSAYIFLIEDGNYCGIVTHMAISKRIIESTGHLEL